MDQQELLFMLKDLESDLVERKASLSNPDRIRQVICAFANDLPDHRRGIQIAKQQLRANGNPPPQFDVEQSYILATVRKQ